MQKEKDVKVYTGNKTSPKKPKKNPLEQITKKFNIILKKAMAGSIQHIAILVGGVLVTVAVIAGVGFGIAGFAGGNGETPSGEYNEIEIDPEADNNYNKDEAVIDTDKFKGTILPETEDAGQKYIDETLFIGDSNTVRSLFYDVTGTTWNNIVGAVSMGIQHVASDPIAISEFGSGVGKVNVETSVKLIQPKRIIMTYGTNNTNWDVDTFITEYKKAAKAVYNAYPYSDIIINAIPPVDKIRDYPNVTMQQVDKFNAALAEMCEAEGYKFLNSAEVMKDEATGFAKKDYTISDGIHLSKNGFDALFTYIRTHAYETEDKRPKLSYVPPRLETTPMTIGEDPVAVRGRVTVIFTSSDSAIGYVDGEAEQKIRPTLTTDPVTAVPKDGGVFKGWECEYGGISDAGSKTITYTAPDGTQDLVIYVTAKFEMAGMSISASSINLTPGDSHTLTANADGGHGIKWSSNNPDVASVNDGKVKAHKAGTAKITASILDGKVYATCTVTVSDTIKSIEIKADKDGTTIEVGKTSKLGIQPDPVTATVPTITWTTSDATIATVSTTGLVTGVKEGKVTITASINGGKLTDTIEITVGKKTIAPTSITVTADKTSVEVGATANVKVTFAPEGATGKVTYASADTSIATVDSNGVVKGVKAGEVAITVKVDGTDISGSVKIKVTAKATQATPTPAPATPTLSLTPGSASVEVGKSTQLTATASSGTVVFTSSDNATATVDSTGKVIGVKAGTVTITAKIDGTTVTQTATITVTAPAAVACGYKGCTDTTHTADAHCTTCDSTSCSAKNTPYCSSCGKHITTHCTTCHSDTHNADSHCNSCEGNVIGAGHFNCPKCPTTPHVDHAEGDHCPECGAVRCTAYCSQCSGHTHKEGCPSYVAPTVEVVE